MIKVIASDMDGTLLGNDHMVAPRTLEAIKKAQRQGIRFMIATGRNYRGAMEQLKGLDLECDYLLGSGAEVRNPEKEVVLRVPIPMEECKKVHQILSEFPVGVIFCTAHFDYRFGTEQEMKDAILHQIRLFHTNETVEEILQSELYTQLWNATKQLKSIDELMASSVPVYKIFLFSEDLALLEKIQGILEKNPKIAVAPSFATNLEITDVKAQKGPVLKQYIESLGYKMEEVMVLGDSMNDYSMLSMEFGATVAMENADDRVKKAARYVTKSNEEFGVAYAIEELLKSRQ